MENKKNFYAQYNTIYLDLEKKVERVKIITPSKRILPFPNMPFIDDILSASVKETMLTISNNDEMFFIGIKSNENDDDNIMGYRKYGCMCKVECINVNDNAINYICNVLYRGIITEVEKEKNQTFVTVSPIIEINENTETALLLLQKAKDSILDYINFSNKKVSKDLVGFINSSNDCNIIINLIAVALEFGFDQQYALLKEVNTETRLEDLITFIVSKIQMEEINRKIDEKIRTENDQKHKEAYIKETIKYLSDELGEDDDLAEYEKSIKASNMVEENKKIALNEVAKLRKTSSMSADYGVMRAHIESILELPWGSPKNPEVDLEKAKDVLLSTHYGLDKVKLRILEYLAVLKLNNGVTGQILCLTGAPGVGKTSIVKSIAKAMDRKFVKLTLGGVSDESEIRGHRKTYVGAMCGKILMSLKNVGVNNPVFLLDEIDKMTKDNHGDPTSAMLEILDKEQNSSFKDNYIELPYDLSNVIFIATANDKSNIPAPLLDRMEIIDVDSYTAFEKFNIAKKYLIAKQALYNGITVDDIVIPDDVIFQLIDNYTYEAGVRNLERLIAKFCRYVAMEKVTTGSNFKLVLNKENFGEILDIAPVIKGRRKLKDSVGVTNGLGWSPYGGSILMVECITINGKGNLIQTGNMMDVMKESSQIAFTVAKKFAFQDGFDPKKLKNIDVYLNACEGGIKKDGPSAGSVMTLAIYSALMNKKIKYDFAFTGEINLNGDITAIGGLREKLYACVQNEINNVALPKENMIDLKFISKDIKDKLNIYFVENFAELKELCIVD